MKIRGMTINDYPAVYALWKNTPGMGLNTLDDSQDGISRFLNRNPSTCLVAERGGNVAAVILSGHDGRRGFIYHLCVHPDHRRMGLGTSLVDLALTALREEGIAKVACVVFSHNETGNSFWQSMGFSLREDLLYRNRVITEKKMSRIDI